MRRASGKLHQKSPFTIGVSKRKAVMVLFPGGVPWWPELSIYIIRRERSCGAVVHGHSRTLDIYSQMPGGKIRTFG